MSAISKDILNFFKSLRFRVLIIILVVGIVPVTVFQIYYLNKYEDNLIQSRIDKLKTMSVVTKNTIITSDYLKTHSSSAVDAELSQAATVFDGRTMIIDKAFKVIKDTYSLDEGNVCLSESVIQCFKGQNTIQYSEEKSYIEIALALSSSEKNLEDDYFDGVLLMTFSIKDISDNLKQERYNTDIIIILIWIVVITVAVISQIFISRPFKKMAASIDNVKLGQFDRKLSCDGYTELREVGESIEHMMKRMKELDESRQEFVSNVSHELKTPITSIKVLADSLVMQENVPVEMYREFMTDIVAEIDRENSIITDLLTLVKLEKKTEALKIEKINVNEMVELVLKRLRPIAAKKNIELVFESFRPVSAEIDDVKMTMVVSNLVENAIKYNVLDGWVRVSLNADYQYFYLKVSDSGIGMPEESLSHIFERFYRVDKTRSRETGGTGLGLSITYNAIIMHKGDIKVYSREGEGTTFTIRIPLVYAP